jgi:chemotaxis protein CheD
VDRYYDSHLSRNVVKILPGEFTLIKDSDVAVTVLGSCVAACVRDERLKTGGMNHFMLPAARTKQFMEAARYGVHAMEMLINAMLKRGSARRDLSVKLFGGAAVLQQIASIDIGKENGAFAKDFCRMEGLRLIAHDLYGPWPRKIYFVPESGEVHVKYLRTLKNDTILRREEEYAARLEQLRVGGGTVTWLGKSAS